MIVNSCSEVCFRCLVLGECRGCSLVAGSNWSSGARVTADTGSMWN